MKRVLAIFTSFLMILSLFVACAGNGDQLDNAGPQATSGVPSDSGSQSDSSETSSDGEPDDEHYTFTYYFNYDWYTLHEWADDLTSKKWQEQFNIDIVFDKPDADPETKLSLMISSGDLPDCIMMERGASNKRLADLGLLVDLEPLKANNPTYDEYILPQSQELLKIDGKLYAIPQWPRTAPTGGNDCWMYNKRIYEAAGSPDLRTFEDLYAYAVSVKENVPENNEGLPVIPLTVDGSGAHWKIVKGFYRSYGGHGGQIYTSVDGTYQLAFRDPVFERAVMEVNKWYREGLIASTNFTDSNDQIVEKLVAGRVGLLWYPMDRDDTNHFRKILRESFPGDDYIVLDNPVHPPANGLSEEQIYADEKATVGADVICITTNAEKPQRIFDFLVYLYTKQGAIEQIYGPQGELWDELDANGNPILKRAEGDLTAEEVDALGMWFWCIPGHADSVDFTNFAVNETLPEDARNWVVSVGANILTPIMFVTDEYNGIADVIDPQSDNGINRTLCEDRINQVLPQILMASTPEEAKALYDELIAFCDDNGMPEVERIFNDKYQENVQLQGYTAYDR